MGTGIAVTACVLGAVYCIARGLDGWGWLLFVALLISEVF